ncbi:MAG: hypothetical protein JSS21_03835 [Proteobacteria bacterium]|nr:hypothetical protein [Pseudomonadota bacterium]
MNLHFEDRRKLHALARPLEPARDLWPQIAARIDSASRASHRGVRWLAWAASLACVAVLAGAIGIRMIHAGRAPATAAPPDAFVAANAPAARWNPADPRLRGAAVELRAAQGELKQALAIAPHAGYLQQLLEHTERQQSRLQRLDRDAG